MPIDPDATVVRPPGWPRRGSGPSVAPDATVVRPPTRRPADLTRTRTRRAAPDPDATVIRSLGPQPAQPGQPLPMLPRETALALAPGFLLHEYRIDAVLGQGGFGITYLATDVHLNAAVAIKEYLPEEIAFRAGDRSVSPNASRHQDRYRQGLESFLVEARTLATFRHPSIVRVARFFEAHRTAYMVLEYERGSPLKTWWPAHAQIGEAGLVELLLPLLDGLAVVHAAGFLHRDIKPDNIQVRATDGRLVLLDFGSAGQTVAVAEQGAVVLTPGYAPLEQYGLGEQGAWTDLYALGATLYWAVTGSKPPDAELRMASPSSHVPAVKAGHGRYGESFLKAIDWALNMDAAQRPPDVGAWRRALCADHLSSLGLQEALQRGDSQPDDHRATPRERAFARLRRGLRTAFSPPDWPLALKMTLAMLATALLPMAITGVYNLRGSTAAVSEGELRFVEQIANSTAGRISQFLTATRYLARSMGSDDDFSTALAQGDARDDAHSLAALGDKLARIVQANPDLQRISLLDTSGKVLVSSQADLAGRNFAGERYFQEATLGRAYASGLVVDPVSGSTGMVLAEPVSVGDKGSVLGVLALRIRGSSLDAIIDEVRNDATLTPFLIDRDGVVLHHLQEDLRFRSLMPLPPATLAAIRADQRFGRDTIESLNEPVLAQAMVGAQHTGHVDYHSTLDQRDEIAGFAPVTAHEWVLGVTKSRTDFEAPLAALYRGLQWSVALVGLLFTGLALRFAHSIVRPIRALTNAANALKEGDYNKAGVEVQRRDELGQLGRTFNVMIDVLRQRDRERRRD